MGKRKCIILIVLIVIIIVLLILTSVTLKHLNNDNSIHRKGQEGSVEINNNETEEEEAKINDSQTAKEDVEINNNETEKESLEINNNETTKKEIEKFSTNKKIENNSKKYNTKDNKLNNVQSTDYANNQTNNSVKPSNSELTLEKSENLKYNENKETEKVPPIFEQSNQGNVSINNNAEIKPSKQDMTINYTTSSCTSKSDIFVKKGNKISDYEISINAPIKDDAMATFYVGGLNKNDFYEVSADIMVESIGWESSSYGFGIGKYWSWASSKPIRNTTNPTKIKAVIKSSENGELKFNTRLGFWNNAVSGKGSFKNINIKKVSDIPNEYKLICSKDNVVRVVFDKEEYDNSKITDEKAILWADKLSRTRSKYEELVGSSRYNGKVDIIATNYYNSAWAFADDPIEWMSGSQTNSLESVKNTDEWIFGILHEISHTYDDDKWNFDAEMWANTKMVYALEKLNGMVVMPYGSINRQYQGAEIKEMYKYNYDHDGGCSKNDGITYELLEYKDKITETTGVDGWEAFKKTFRYFANLSVIPSTKQAKFELFMNKLVEYSGVDYKTVFTETDLSNIRVRYAQ